MGSQCEHVIINPRNDRAACSTAESIDAGMVIVEIGVAPVKPAEFVIFRLAQFSGGASISD